MDKAVTVKVFSETLWSHTGVQLAAGAGYRIAVIPPEQTWLDASLIYTADGGTSFLQRFFRPWLRVRGDGQRRAEFFTLIGTIGESLDHAFVIGTGPREFTAPVSGELVCFANDCPFAYHNNHGSIDVSITPLGSGSPTQIP